MFYSHTFLARKGPLGTVWCAAHLQHKLKKSHYASTDIASTVDRIMFPEVPIALRMSSHLLLGVVRIYSKKVDYLYQDCNVVLIGIRKAFASIEVNLPEDATHAPFHSVTLPDTFELDALDLDDDLYHEGAQDSHLRSREEITLTDQIPVGEDLYVAITFDEDIMTDLSRPEEVPDSGFRPMEEDVLPPLPVDNNVGSRDPDPSNQTEDFNERVHADNFPQNFPEIEVMRDADNLPQNFPEIEVMRDVVHDFHSESLPVWPDDRNDVTEPSRSLDQIINEKEILTPIVEDMLVSGGQSLPFQQHLEPSNSAASEEAPEILDPRISFGHVSPELAVRSTPPVERPRARPRKRKQLFDRSPGLSNKFIKEALEDSSNLLRKRKHGPCSALDVWKFNSSSKKELIFLEPAITGLCADLRNIFKEGFISTKPHLVFVNEACPEPRVAQSPAPLPAIAQSPAPMPDLNMEIEHLRHYEGYAGAAGSNVLPELMPSPGRFMPSPSRRDDFTPDLANNLGWSGSEPQMGTSTWTGVLPTPDLAASTGPLGSELETPMTFLEEQLGVENTGLSDIPELMNSAEAEDLNFLEADNNTPTGSQGTREVDTLSVRTRAVAQYLRRHSPVTQISEELSGDLSLNKILVGKRRKLCARMFFETLVLKSYGLVDVQQEQPYGDITLKLTPTLTKAQF